MKGLKIGEYKEVEFRQSDDWRLFYALNPFHIKREESNYLVYQNIRFDTTGKIYAVLNLGVVEIKIPDNIVHVFDCHPFVAICRIKAK